LNKKKPRAEKYKELTIQLYRQHCTRDTERRKSKHKNNTWIYEDEQHRSQAKTGVIPGSREG